MTIIDILVEECEKARPSLLTRGVVLDITRADEGPKPGVRIDATAGTALAQVVLWIGGELDVLVGEGASGEILVNEHRSVSTRSDMTSVLDLVERYLALDA